MRTPINQLIENIVVLLQEETKLTEDEIIETTASVLNVRPSKVIDVINKIDL